MAWLGVDASLATEWERDQVAGFGLHVWASESLSTDPSAAAAEALRVLPSGPLAIHVDVDVLDFTDAPLAENTDGRNTGPTIDQLGQVLEQAARDPRLRALSIGELNPTRSAGDPSPMLRFVEVLAAALSRTLH